MAEKNQELTKREAVLEAFEKYTDIEGTILDDYMCGDDGMFTELAAAEENFKDEIEMLLLDDVDGKTFLKKIKESLENNVFDESELLSLVDEDTILSHAASLGYVCVKIENLADEMKLEEFVKEQIYPFYSDQDTKLFA